MLYHRNKPVCAASGAQSPQWGGKETWALPLSKAAAGLVSALIAAANAAHPGASQTGNPHAQKPPAVVRTMVGNASWYGPGFYGRRTASGEPLSRNRSTVASRHLPFGTRVRVTFLRTGRSAEARVNDRGPFVRSRIIDCSEALARQIGLRGAGRGKVKIEVLAQKKPGR
jgi:rare lipoprotein A